MKKLTSLFAGGALLFAAHVNGAESSNVTVGDMLDWCKRDTEMRAGLCIGYISGFISYQKVAAGLEILREPMFCLPAGITARQARAIFIKWAEETPQTWQMEADLGVSSALFEAFPCVKP